MTTMKVLVTNASSKTAYSFLPMLCSGDVFGPNHKIELVLFDFKPLAEKVVVLKEELSECCYPNIHSITATVDMNHAFHDVDVAILSELERDVIGFRSNAVLFRSYGIIINTHASRDAKVLVCGKTANTSAFICSSFSPSIPSHNYTCLVQHLQQNIVFNLLQQQKYGGSYSNDSGDGISSSSINNKNKHNKKNQRQQQVSNNEKRLQQFQLQQQQQQQPRVYCKLLDEFMKNNDSLFNNNNNDNGFKNENNNNNNNSNNHNHDSLVGGNVLVWGNCLEPIITSSTMHHTFKSLRQVEPGSMLTAKSMAEHLTFWLTDSHHKEYLNMGVVSRYTPYNIDKNIYFNLPVAKRRHNNISNNTRNNNNNNEEDGCNEARGVYSGSDVSLSSYAAAGRSNDSYGIYNSSVDESYNLATAEGLATNLATNNTEDLTVTSSLATVTLQPLKVKLNAELRQLLCEASEQLCQQRDNAIIDCWRIVLPHSHL